MGLGLRTAQPSYPVAEHLFLILLSGQFLQFFLSFIFSFASSRLISPEEIGSWSQAFFGIKIYASLTDFSLETAAFEATPEANNLSSQAPQQCHFSVLFWFRFFTSLAPLIIVILLRCLLGTVKLYFFLAALFFFFDRVGNLLKIALDKNFAQATAIKWELGSFIGSNFLLFFLGGLGVGGVLFSVQQICEKMFLLLGMLWYRGTIFNLEKFTFGSCFFSAHLRNLLKKYAFPALSGIFANVFIYDFLPFFLSISVSSHAAGLFAKAFSLACLPLLITTVFNRITTPLYGYHMHNLARCKSIFLQSQILKVVVLLPGIFFLQQTANLWLPLLLGARWHGVIPIYRILAVYAFCRSFYDDLGSLISLGLGQPSMMAKNQLFHAAMVVLSLPLLFYCKSVLLAAGFCSLCMLLACARLWYYLFEVLQITAKDIWANIINLKNRGVGFVGKTIS